MNLETASDNLTAAGIDITTLREVLAGVGRPAFAIEVGDADPEELWQQCRAAYDRTGLYPVILTEDAISMMEECLEGSDEESLAKDLRKGRERNGAGWVTHHRREIVDETGELPHGDWPDEEVEPVPLCVGFDDDGEPTPGNLIALVPCEHPSEVIGRLGFGDWNECPSPWVHIAVHRAWHERYGAEPIALAADTLQMRVSRRPATREEALALAEEQMVYCDDLVYQGTETLENLAAALLESDYWFFWWD